MVSTREMPGCCGITIIYDLDDGPYGGYNSIEEALEDCDVCNMVMATTIPEQKKAIAELKRLGFKVLRKPKSNHGTYRITLWGKTLNHYTED